MSLAIRLMTLLLALASLTLAARTHADSLPASPWTPRDGDVIAFDVTRNGERFGTHIVEFRRDGDTLTAETKVDLRAGVGPVTLFRYRLNARETWQGDALIAVNASGRDGDGKAFCEAELRDGQLAVRGSAYTGALPEGTPPSSHWNRLALTADVLLSTQTGEPLPIDAVEAGRESIQIAGRNVSATRYDIAAKLPYSVWYDDAGRWVKLVFTTRGQSVEYHLRQLY